MKENPIRTRLGEIKGFIIKLSFFETLLDTLIVFGFFAIIFRVFGIYAHLAVIPSLATGGFSLILKLRRLHVLETTVKKRPSLDERLQTAKENAEEDNIIARDLTQEVAKRIDVTPTSIFIGKAIITRKILASLVLFFLFLTINFINIEDLGFNPSKYLDQNIIKSIEDATGFGISRNNYVSADEDDNFQTKNKIEDQTIGGRSGGKQPGVSEGPLPGKGGGTGMDSGDIFGEETDIDLEGRDIGMEMQMDYGGKIEVKNIESGDKSENYYPGEGPDGESSAQASQEPLEYQSIIQKYFKTLQEQER